MKRLTLRAEHLGELPTEELRRVAGAAAGGEASISFNSCFCTVHLGIVIAGCDVSLGSCAWCGCGEQA